MIYIILKWRKLTEDTPDVPIFASSKEEYLEKPRVWTKEKVNFVVIILNPPGQNSLSLWNSTWSKYYIILPCITYLTSNDLIFSPETNKNYVLIIVTLTGLNKLQFNLTSLYFGNRRKQPIRLINNLRGLFVAWQASTGNRNERLCCFDKHIKKIRKH